MVCSCLVVLSRVPKTYLKNNRVQVFGACTCSPTPSKTVVPQGSDGRNRDGRAFFFFFGPQICSAVLFVLFFFPSRSRGSSLLAHERIAAVDGLLLGGRLVLGRDDDGVLVHQLAGGVGESRQGQGDPLHLALIDPLLVLLLQVSTPEHEGETVSEVTHS